MTSGPQAMAMRIRRKVLDSIAAHARECSPHECCGILTAREAELATISHSLQASNVEQECPSRRYVLGHKAHLAAVKLEASRDARIVGYYHSHPSGDAMPSARDTDQAVPDTLYLIVGLRNGSADHAAWRLEDGRLVQQPLEVDE
jgi:proteasome lid subunit RPN8/RPN11